MSGMGSGGLPGRSGGAWRSTRRFGRGREALPVGWEVSGGPINGSGGVAGPSEWPGEVRSRWESHLEGLEGSGGPHGGPGAVRRPSLRSGGVGRTSSRSGRPIRRSGKTTRGSGVVRWPTRGFGRVR